MDAPRDPVAATPRRTFLKLLALAPAAAACAGAGGAARSPDGARAAGTEPAEGSSPAAPEGPDPLAAIREFPLPAGSEPAFVFRAAAARPRI
jgi:hypothetical protein